MRVSSYAVARPNYYDRNAAGGRSRYYGTVGPHAQTLRFTVTIGAGKKAFAELVAVRLQQVTVATATSRADSVIDSTDGTTNTSLSYAALFTSLTNANQYVFNASPAQQTLYAGDALKAYTEDGSTGGTVLYVVDARYTTFDA